jgi:hypothetical protein
MRPPLNITNQAAYRPRHGIKNFPVNDANNDITPNEMNISQHLSPINVIPSKQQEEIKRVFPIKFVSPTQEGMKRFLKILVQCILHH